MVPKKKNLKNKLILFVMLSLCCFFHLYSEEILEAHERSFPFENYTFKQLPVLFKGRFRPMEVYARLWLNDLSHSEEWIITDSPTEILSASELIWKLNILGYHAYETVPLFYISSQDIKTIFLLNPNEQRFSYRDLYERLYQNKEINLALMAKLIPYYFFKEYKSLAHRSHSKRQTLSELSPLLTVQLQEDKLVIISAPKTHPWHFLENGMIIANGFHLSDSKKFKDHKHLADAAIDLITTLNTFGQNEGAVMPMEQAFETAYIDLELRHTPPKEIWQTLDLQFPLSKRLNNAGNLLRMLPNKYQAGEWLSLRALKIQVYNPSRGQLELIGNFTSYSDEQFKAIQSEYLELERAIQKQHEAILHNDLLDDKTASIQKIPLLVSQLSDHLKRSYRMLAGKKFKEGADQALYYPSLNQLRAEFLYYQIPFIELILAVYFLGVIALIASSMINRGSNLWKNGGFFFIVSAFSLHTIMLGVRCYILHRPPVSNMFETITYVPWLAVAVSFGLMFFFHQRLILIASSLVAIILLILLQLTQLSRSLDNVQAVLNSHYWLIIHVLMVVGSYALFAIAGVLGHFYLISWIIQRTETPFMISIAKLLLQTLYIGIILLVVGTILGGVWAAESWGRFWDWDPKESWAFITSCIYLIWIHAYRFHYIQNFGLAMGSIVGVQAMSFTWYGVNYVLGTGLHSYGFGSGGEVYYYTFLLLEFSFLIVMSYIKKNSGKNRLII